MTIEYTGGTIKVTIGQQATVKLPPRVLRARIVGLLFETAKTFLLPRALTGMKQLVRYYNDHPSVHVLVSGHTDTVGNADYNRGLSMERADAIKYFLTRKSDEWMKWYAGKQCSDAWGVREDQYMLATLRAGDGTPYFADAVDGKLDDATRAAYQRFQGDNGLARSGSGDQATRHKLVDGYLALDGASLPASAPEPLTHGCGLFHLEVQTGANVDEQRNRRVEVFLFEGDVKPPPRALCPWGGCPEYPEWLERTKETVDVDLDPGTITARVVDDKGAAVAQADVSLSGEASDAKQSDAKGAAAFTQLPPGKYTVVAKKSGFLPALADVTVAPEVDAHANLALAKSDVVVFKEGDDPEGGRNEITVPDGTPLSLRWRIFGDWKKVELFNAGVNDSVELTYLTSELGDVDTGFAPFTVRKDHAASSSSGGGFDAAFALRVTRSDGSKDPPRALTVHVQPASAASGGIDFVSSALPNAALLGIRRIRRA
jgi:hypothetical protein